MIPQAVIFDEAGQVLLVKRTNPRAWEIPGGFMNPGERPEATIAREVHEETGLNVHIEGLLGWYERTGFRPHLSPVYVCRPASGTLRVSFEAVAAAFFPPARLPLSLFPWYRTVIAHALAARLRDAGPDVTPREPAAPRRIQHLGVLAVIASLGIHVGTRLGLLP